MNHNIEMLIKTRLTRTVRVSDPWHWYDENTVVVSMGVTPPSKNGEVDIYVSVSSIDDFSVSRRIEENIKYEASVQCYYDHFKKYLFDRMPDEISVEWLYEHGYLPS